MNRDKQNIRIEPGRGTREGAAVVHAGRVTRQTTDVAALIPASVLNPELALRSRRRRRIAMTGMTALVLAGSGVAVANASTTQAPGYRTASVATQSVDAVLNAVASIEPVSQASVAFPVSGTVATVDVALGDAVTAGETVATLDTASLLQALHEQQSNLANAQLLLTEALAGHDISGLTGAGGPGATGFADTSAGSATFSLLAVTTSDDTDLVGAQQAVLSGQQAVDSALAAASTAMSAATAVCDAIGIDATSDASSVLSSLTACQTALGAVLTAQNTVSSAQTALASASTALDTLLAGRTAAVTTGDAGSTTSTATPSDVTPTTTTPPSATSVDPAGTVDPATSPAVVGDPSATGPGATSDSTVPTGGGSGSPGGGASAGGGGAAAGGGGGGGAVTSPPSAADLIAYQSSVDAAAAAVAAAEQAVARAAVASPIDGTVIAVNIAPGDSETAASTTQNIVIQGAGGFEASTTIALADVPGVSIGQSATVLPDGATVALTGQVVSISAVPDSSTSYGVVIALDGHPTSLDNGAIGSASIVTGTTNAAVAVPTSAIATDGSTHTVRIVDGATTTVTRVQVGVVGNTWTEITNGLTVGQQVVLADLGAALPTSATASSNASTTGGGAGGAGFGGGPRGGFGGGAPGAAP